MIGDAVDRVDSSSVLDACLRIFGRRPTEPTPDAVARAVTGVAWRRYPDWERQDDAEIATNTGMLKIPFVGAEFVVTEASFVGGHGAVVVNPNRLAEYVSEHLRRFGECFFNGDVLLVDSTEPHVWVFHHEGVYANLTGGTC